MNAALAQTDGDTLVVIADRTCDELRIWATRLGATWPAP
jgi:hypothetical protein